jgi:hypothetical protein
MLAPGEHVLTANDVDLLGGQGGAYRFRAALRAGDVQAFAKGGAVRPKRRRGSDVRRGDLPAPKRKRPKGPSAGQLANAAVLWGGRVMARGGTIVRESDIARQDRIAGEKKREVTSDTAAIKRAQAALKARERAEARAQKAYDAIGSGKKERAAKRRARAALDTAKKRTTSAERTVKSREDERDKDRAARTAALATAKQLRQDREDFVSAERRNPNRRVTDPLAYVDQLRAMSRDEEGFSAGRRRKFATAANQYEAALVKNTGLLDKATEKLDGLKQASDQLRDSVAGAVSGGYRASDAGSTPTASGWTMRGGIRFRSYSTGPSAGSLATYYTQGAASAKRFADDLARLARRGYPDALVAEVAGYGVAQGQPIVTALLAATGSQQASISRGYNSIGGSALRAGTTVANDTYAGKIAETTASVNTLTAQVKGDGEKLRKLIATAFGLKGYATGTASAASGIRWVGEDGPELVGFKGGERVLTAQDSARWVRGAGGSPGRVQVVRVQVAMPSTMDLVDAGGQLISTVRTVARDVAVQEITADALHDAVLMSGGAA